MAISPKKSPGPSVATGFAARPAHNVHLADPTMNTSTPESPSANTTVPG
jgi:hypothetical protein